MADDLRAQLVKALWEAPYDQEDQADAIVPVVRQALADERERLVTELRQRAEDHRSEYPGAYADGLDAAADLVAGAEDAGHGDGDGGREGEPVDPPDH